MKWAAELTAHKYGWKTFCVYETKRSYIKKEYNELHLYGRKCCSGVLRCFGRIITKLCLGISDDRFWPYLDEYIAEYWAHKLTEFEIV